MPFQIHSKCAIRKNDPQGDCWWESIRHAIFMAMKAITSRVIIEGVFFNEDSAETTGEPLILFTAMTVDFKIVMFFVLADITTV